MFTHLKDLGILEGKCLACGAAYSPERRGHEAIPAVEASEGIEARPALPAKADEPEQYPGSFFNDPISWSLHHERCRPDLVANGTIDAPVFVPVDHADNHYPGPGKPAGPWKKAPK